MLSQIAAYGLAPALWAGRLVLQLSVVAPWHAPASPLGAMEYIRPAVHWRPAVCEASIMATRLQIMVSYWKQHSGE